MLSRCNEGEGSGETVPLIGGQGSEEAFLFGSDDGLCTREVVDARVRHSQDDGAAVVLAGRAVQQTVTMQTIHEARGCAQRDALALRHLLDAAGPGIPDRAQDQEAPQ